MLLTLCAIGALGVTGLAVLIRAAFVAPHGVEDENGFHSTGIEKPAEAKEALLSTSDVAFFTR